MTGERDTRRLETPGVAYLISVLGTASSQRWQTRMGELGLDPREVVVLRMVAAEPGRSQRSLAPALQVRVTHLVAVIDEMQRKGFIERRPNLVDRRAHALYLTDHGHRTLNEVMVISEAHERELTGPLDERARLQLQNLLVRMTAHLGLAEGGHPGFDEVDR
jgi:DNA-binding MarR family transcriptional regulator